MSKVKKSTKQVVKCIKDAKAALVLTIDVGEKTYQFEADIFDLDKANIGILNGQISKIPGHIAFMGITYSEVEEYLQKKELAFDVWKSSCLVTHFGDNKVYKSETDKMNNLKKEFAKDYVAWEDELRELRKLVKILKVYEKGMDAKMQLAQTLSANIRAEREAIQRKYDKDNNKGSL